MTRNWVLETSLAFDPVTDDAQELKAALSALRATASKKAMRGGERGGYYSTLTDELTPAKYDAVEAELLDYATRHRMAEEVRQIAYAELDKLAEVNPEEIDKIRKMTRTRVREITGVPDWDISEEDVRARIGQLGAVASHAESLPGNPADVFARFKNADDERMKGYELKLRPLFMTVGVADLYGYLEKCGLPSARSANSNVLVDCLRTRLETLSSASMYAGSEEQRAAEKDLAAIGLEMLESGLQRDYDAFLAKRSVDAVLSELDMLPAGATVSPSVSCRQAGELASFTASPQEAALLLLGCTQSKNLVCTASYEDLCRAAGGSVAGGAGAAAGKTKSGEPTAARGAGRQARPDAGASASAEEVIRRARERARANAPASDAPQDAGPGDEPSDTAPNPWQTSDYSAPDRSSRSREGWGCRIVAVILIAPIVLGVLLMVVGGFMNAASTKSEPVSSHAAPAVISAGYDASYSGPLFPAISVENNQVGYLGTGGQWAIQPTFKTPSIFEEGLALQQDSLSGLYGYINVRGEWAIEPRFAEAFDFSSGYARVKDGGGEQYFIDATGSRAFVGQLDGATPLTNFGDGHAWVKVASGGSGSPMKVIDTSGAVVGELAEAQLFGSHPHEFHEGLSAWRESSGSFCFVDTTGAVVIRGNYRAVSAFGNGYAAAQSSESGKWGYIDKTGKTVVADQFDEATNFTEGYARVKSGKYYHYVDTSFAPIDFDFVSGDLFRDGLVCGGDASHFGLFNTAGELVVDLLGIADSCWTDIEEVYSE